MNSTFDRVYDGVVHDGLDVLLLGDLEELLSVGRGCEFFGRGEEEELILYVLYRQRIDDDSVAGVGKGGLGPGDGVGGDGTVDHAVVGDSALVECGSQGILFNFSRKETVIISPSKMDT